MKLWKRLVCGAPGLLTVMFSDTQLLFMSSEFAQRFSEIAQYGDITLNEIKDRLGKVKSTGSLNEASMWEKISQYKESGATCLRTLGEFVHSNDNDDGEGKHYFAKIERIQYADINVCLLQITDITDVKKVQHEILGKKYKNILFTTASHELKTPLNGILGGMQLIMQSKDMASIKEYCSIIEGSCKLLINITDDMLDYCLYESGELTLSVTEIYLREVFNEAIKIIEVQTKQRGVNLIFNYDPNIPEIIRTDRKRLMQIFLNILGNSAKYTFHGSIMITAENHDFDVFIKVMDTGIGINETKKAGLFKLFGQLNTGVPRRNSKLEAGAGSGLGLSVSQALASLLGTGISFTSTEGRGSEFSFAVNKEIKNKRCNSATSSPIQKVHKPKMLTKQSTFLNPKRKHTLGGALLGKGIGHTISLIQPMISLDAEADNLTLGSDEGSGLSPRRCLNKYVFPSKNIFSDDSMKFTHNPCHCPDILIVDDNAFNLLVLKKLLERLGLACATVCALFRKILIIGC